MGGGRENGAPERGLGGCVQCHGQGMTDREWEKFWTDSTGWVGVEGEHPTLWEGLQCGHFNLHLGGKEIPQ